MYHGFNATENTVNIFKNMLFRRSPYNNWKMLVYCSINYDIMNNILSGTGITVNASIYGFIFNASAIFFDHGSTTDAYIIYAWIRNDTDSVHFKRVQYR